MGVPKDRPLPAEAEGLGKTMAHGDFMLRLEGEVICRLVEGESGYWQGRKGQSDGKNDLDKSRGSEKHRLYRQKYKFGWKCIKGYGGD